MGQNLKEEVEIPLRIATLPAATGAITARKPRTTGAFHGAMPRITPRGSLKTSPYDSPWVKGIEPVAIEVVRLAHSSMMPTLSLVIISAQSEPL
jgi:hypothetical protein